MSPPRAVLVALDSVGVDPLGHDRPESVYRDSTFLFPKGARGPALELPDAPREGLLVETDVTHGRAQGAIECALTYTSIFSGRDAIAEHGLMQGLGLRDDQLDALIDASNLFTRYASPCLANALFPVHFPFMRDSYVADQLPRVERIAIDGKLAWEGEPVRLRGGDKRGFAELFTVAEINQNVFVYAAQQAGVGLRTWNDVRAGRALTGSLTNALENAFDFSLLGLEPLPAWTPKEGAEVLAGLAAEHDFVFYKYQLADLISHTGRVDLAREVFGEIEAFLGALLAKLDPETRLVVTSDHGHLEQVAFSKGHPKSLVPTWSFGPGAQAWGRGLTQPQAIFELLADA